MERSSLVDRGAIAPESSPLCAAPQIEELWAAENASGGICIRDEQLCLQSPRWIINSLHVNFSTGSYPNRQWLWRWPLQGLLTKHVCTFVLFFGAASDAWGVDLEAVAG